MWDKILKHLFYFKKLNQAYLDKQLNVDQVVIAYIPIHFWAEVETLLHIKLVLEMGANYCWSRFSFTIGEVSPLPIFMTLEQTDFNPHGQNDLEQNLEMAGNGLVVMMTMITIKIMTNKMGCPYAIFLCCSMRNIYLQSPTCWVLNTACWMESKRMTCF